MLLAVEGYVQVAGRFERTRATGSKPWAVVTYTQPVYTEGKHYQVSYLGATPRRLCFPPRLFVCLSVSLVWLVGLSVGRSVGWFDLVELGWVRLGWVGLIGWLGCQPNYTKTT